MIPCWLFSWGFNDWRGQDRDRKGRLSTGAMLDWQEKLDKMFDLAQAPVEDENPGKVMKKKFLAFIGMTSTVITTK